MIKKNSNLIMNKTFRKHKMSNRAINLNFTTVLQ